MADGVDSAHSDVTAWLLRSDFGEVVLQVGRRLRSVEADVTNTAVIGESDRVASCSDCRCSSEGL